MENLKKQNKIKIGKINRNKNSSIFLISKFQTPNSNLSYHTSHRSTLTSHHSGITLIALVVTIVILLILAAVTINLVLAEGGLFERAQQSEEEHEKAVAREKLELKLADMQAEKLVNNRNYTEGKKDYEYLSTELWEEGYIVNGDIVTVDDWQFIIDRSVPKIIDDTLGKGEKDDSITIECSEVTEKPYTFSTITVKITSGENIQSIIFNGENILELIDKDENYSVDTEGNYIIKVTENKIYNIYVQNISEKYNSAKIEVNKITEDMDIWNKADLILFSEKVNEGRTFEGKKATVMADIDLNEGKYTVAEDGTVTFTSDAEKWTPIGEIDANTTIVFQGTFDGNYKKISGMYINSTNNWQGFFRDIGEHGKVKNTIINNSSVMVSCSGDAYAGLISAVNSGTIENCGVYGNVSGYGSGNLRISWIGGIVGSNLGTVSGCYNYANVKAIKTNSLDFAIAGGIVAVNQGTIIDCYNYGEITSSHSNGSGNCVSGGIAGYVDKAINIKNCYNIGNLKYENGANVIQIAAIVGRNGANGYDRGTLENCYYVPFVINSSEITAELYYSGSGATYLSSTIGKVDSTTLQGYASNLGEAFTNDIQNPNGTWKYNNGYPILKWQLKQ